MGKFVAAAAAVVLSATLALAKVPAEAAEAPGADRTGTASASADGQAGKVSGPRPAGGRSAAKSGPAVEAETRAILDLGGGEP